MLQLLQGRAKAHVVADGVQVGKSVQLLIVYGVSKSMILHTVRLLVLWLLRQ